MKKISFNAADISTIDAGTQLQLVGADGGMALLEIIAAGATASPYTVYRQMRGTLASPTATKSGDAVGTAVYRGRAATKFTNTVAYVLVTATEDYTDTANGTQMVFSTTLNGTNASRVVGSWGQDGVLNANYGSKITGISDVDVSGTLTSSAGYKLRNGGSQIHTWYLSSNTTSTWEIGSGAGVFEWKNSNGQLVTILANGVLKPNFGINLGGTANLTAYDEGTWTPTATGLGGTGITYSAKWTKIGNRVDFTVMIAGTALVSTANSTKLSLPFTPALNSACAVMSDGFAYGGIAAASANGNVYLPSIASTTSMIITGTIFLN